MKTRDLAKIVNFYARFMPTYTKTGYLARRLTWGSGPKLDFTGQTWLVTGASAGIGQALAIAAAQAGADVIAAARSQQRLEAAFKDLKPEERQRIRLVEHDLSLKSGNQALVDRLVSEGARIDVLQNNVGLLLGKMQLTSEGVETSFATNVLMHYLLTEGLIQGGVLKDDATVVNMTSGGMYNAPLGIKKLNVTDPEKYSGKIAYAYAKRAQVGLTTYWNQKYRDRGMRFYVTHPGWSKTPGVKTAMPLFWKIQNVFLRTPLQGADTALWLCQTKPEITGEDVIWFDRAPRETHMYDFTRTPQCTVEELAGYLEQELAAIG
ncbi:MAG TPA: SDR family NAD(P)-dependent oxidoreductase [Xanthomonadales bacterium]|nr:SDR family NAD(P)-dependent oxidoreductase [Xanthomonadales bacterium]